MNRELKFRAWDKKNKYMVDSMCDEYIDFEGDAYQRAETTYDTPNIEIERAEDYILMQYTGLKDKNGKEIYEGDILQINPDDDDWFDEVIFWSDRWQLKRYATVCDEYSVKRAKAKKKISKFKKAAQKEFGFGVISISDEHNIMDKFAHDYRGTMVNLRLALDKENRALIAGNIHQNPELL